MQLSLIVAMDNEGLIGRDGTLPWHLSADLRRFKAITMGHGLLMGRRTFESIGRPLPGRQSIVLSRSDEWHRQLQMEFPAVLCAHNLKEAFSQARTCEQLFVIGGSEIYDQTLDLAERLYLTRINATLAGDTFFPRIDWALWKRIDRQIVADDPEFPYPYRFEVYRRTA